jgi:hypothetical protein
MPASLPATYMAQPADKVSRKSLLSDLRMGSKGLDVSLPSQRSYRRAACRRDIERATSFGG